VFSAFLVPPKKPDFYQNPEKIMRGFEPLPVKTLKTLEFGFRACKVLEKSCGALSHYPEKITKRKWLKRSA